MNHTGDHFVRRCECGRVMDQCRCPGPNKRVEIHGPCGHTSVVHDGRERAWCRLSVDVLIADPEAQGKVDVEQLALAIAKVIPDALAFDRWSLTRFTDDGYPPIRPAATPIPRS